MRSTNKGLPDMERRLFIRNCLQIAGAFLVLGLFSLALAWVKHRELSLPGILALAAALAMTLTGTLGAAKRRRRIAGELEQFAFSVDSATRTAVMNFPSPMAVFAVNGAIQWYNSRFASMVGREDLLGEYIQDLFPELQYSKFVEDEDPTPEDYIYKDRNYAVIGKAVRTRRNDVVDTMVGLYFTDLTELYRTQKQMADKEIAVCCVTIDSYDEVFKSTPNASHGALIAAVDHCVNQWVEQGNGVVTRYERDKYIVFFEAAPFRKLLEEKFRLLSDVKNIHQGNRLQVTLSIGAGMQGGTLRENDTLAEAALEMALGRGGDQAVVKTHRGFQFYGARSREVEKSTKVKARVVAHAFRDLAEHASNVIFMGHRNSDADSLGACMGLFRVLRSRNIEAYIAIDRNRTNAHMILDPLFEKSDYKNRIVHLERAIGLVNEKTLLVVVDTHRPSMVEFPELLRNTKNVVMIDHHRRSEEFINDTALTYHEPFASSSSEMVTEMVQYLAEGQILESYEAEALYSGIYMDTKGFTFKTGVRTFEAASYLRRQGVDPVNVRRLFRNDLEMYVQKSRIISRAKVYRENIAIAVSEDLGPDTQLVVAQAADELLNIKGIEAAFVLAASGGRIVISGRSLDSVNVQVILEKLGGGGHITIAGAQLKSNSLELAEMRLRAAIDQVVFEDTVPGDIPLN